ncbi:GLIPR1-like protein 1 [Centruroides sculpturatus]|uniref:GLIPR1-like protein 1 n=1 Tax=Centruroides sculpturatus TaxID=218467 RepID=UPI000C6CEC76|nr:GLIPR1-like protein 1 [Centruroides sculpturatus]
MILKYFICLLCISCMAEESFDSNNCTEFQSEVKLKQNYKSRNTVNTGTALKFINGNSGFSRFEENDIVSLMNIYRNNTTPPAADLYSLVWSDALAKLARKWGDRCVNKQGPDKCLNVIGQNIYVGSGDYKDALEEWYVEEKDYIYSTTACRKQCKHYLAMVSSKTYSVGCSRSDCKRSGLKNLIVCNFYPVGVFLKVKPFLEGRACSKCASDEGNASCSHNLCVKSNIKIPEKHFLICAGFRNENDIVIIIAAIRGLIFVMSL